VENVVEKYVPDGSVHDTLTYATMRPG